jgi:hypothetical protein
MLTTPPPGSKKRVVPKNSRLGATTPSKKLNQLTGRDFFAPFFPFSANRASIFRINSVLCSISFARSSADVGKRLPTPVFEKLGSGL